MHSTHPPGLLGVSDALHVKCSEQYLAPNALEPVTILRSYCAVPKHSLTIRGTAESGCSVHVQISVVFKFASVLSSDNRIILSFEKPRPRPSSPNKWDEYLTTASSPRGHLSLQTGACSDTVVWPR